MHDEVLRFGLWLIGQGLVKTIEEKPEDRRAIHELVSDFRAQDK